MEYKIGQQVVVSRGVRNHSRTKEIRVGTILAFGQDSVDVSIPGPGGVIKRENVSLNNIEPVSERFRRASVQFNPAFRGIAGYRWQ